MRYLICLVLWFSCLFGSLAQSGSAQYVYANAHHSQINKYQFDERYEYLVLASGFARDELRRIPFTDRRILKIDLVYTNFSESEDFDQRQLDLMRLDRLIEINPQIVVNRFFDWNIIGQTGCASSTECVDYFHGFVIYYEEYFTKETAKYEIDGIKSELMDLDRLIVKNQEKLKIEYERIECEYPESVYSQEYLSEQLDKVYDCSENYRGRVFFEVVLNYNGRPLDVEVKGNLFPCKDKLAFALKYVLKWKRGLIIGHRQYDVRAKGFVSFPIKNESVNITSFEISEDLIRKYQMLQQYSQCVAYETDTTFAPILPHLEKRVVSKVLLRNQWNPELIVVDVTGSMYPFTADLLKWLKLTNAGTERHYIFFNDGNDKPTNQKVIGKTGGLYHVKTNDFNEVKARMFEAMSNGGGGDLPENNFEALMSGFNQLSPTGDMIMIADNYSFPRDEAMLARFKGELKILLCHTEKGINTDYLKLARAHNFTLHTLETDLLKFEDKLEIKGDTYIWDGVKYLKR